MSCGITQCLEPSFSEDNKKTTTTMAEEARTILLNAAPGEFDAVAKQLSQLASRQALPGDWLSEIKKEHDLETCVTGNESVSHPLAAPIKEKLKAHQDEAFGSKKNVTYRMTINAGDDSDGFIIKTYAEKVDTANQFSGSWKATWMISGSTSQGDIIGEVKIHTYSHEEGNVQLKTVRNFEDSVSGGDVAQLLMDKIKEWEHEVLALLKGFHEQVPESLRSIRRVLPITKTKMKWDVEAHRNVKTLVLTKPEKDHGHAIFK
jgi:capping protein (actin filament) muscle Z-line, alpha